MSYVVQRLGLKPTRGWLALFLVITAFVVAAFWIGPFRSNPAQLRLVALSGDGRFHEFVGIPSAWADTLPPASEATARFPLILAIHNSGARGAQPNRLALSLPARFRVTDTQGQALPFQRVMGNPLVRYELPIQSDKIEPGQLPRMISGLDTLWLEPIVPTIYCNALSDSVPEFVSAPPLNADLLSNVRIFYSFSGKDIHQRQTGLLTVQVDPNLVKREPAPPPPLYATYVTRPESPRPFMSELRYVGTRTAWCGDPAQPIEIFNALWETPEGGRFFVLHHGGVPRKYLFDLNRDSIIELEMWDQDNDGKFESRRAARFAIPAFLMPYPEAMLAEASDSLAEIIAADTLPPSPEWLGLFHDTAAGPLRFGPKAPAPTDARAAASPSAPVPPPGRVDSAWLGLFNNSDAGPLRFYRAARGETIPPPRPRVRDTGPKLLGVPVEEYRRRPPDSVQRDTLR